MNFRTHTLVASGFASAPNKNVLRFPVFPASRLSRLDPRPRLLAFSLNQRLFQIDGGPREKEDVARLSLTEVYQAWLRKAVS